MNSWISGCFSQALNWETACDLGWRAKHAQKRKLYFRERQRKQRCRNMQRGGSLRSLGNGSMGCIPDCLALPPGAWFWCKVYLLFLSQRFVKYPGSLPINCYYLLFNVAYDILSDSGPCEWIDSHQTPWQICNNRCPGTFMNLLL